MDGWHLSGRLLYLSNVRSHIAISFAYCGDLIDGSYLDFARQDCPEPESEPVSHNRYGFDSSNIDETSLAIKSEIVDDESASGRASAASASVFRKRKLDPCLRASAAPSSSASTGLSTEELMFQDKMIRLVGGQYQCKDCGQIFSRFSSFKFHRNIKHNDDRQAKEPARCGELIRNFYRIRTIRLSIFLFFHDIP